MANILPVVPASGLTAAGFKTANQPAPQTQPIPASAGQAPAGQVPTYGAGGSALGGTNGGGGGANAANYGGGQSSTGGTGAAGLSIIAQNTIFP